MPVQGPKGKNSASPASAASASASASGGGAPAPGGGASAMWGGRFAGGPAAAMEAINASIDFDQRLAVQDIRASKAHAKMLAAQGIISAEDEKAVQGGLDQVLDEITSGNFTFSRALEDIHMNVESRLKDIIGPAAGRLHTARSRNDQVATDFRLWVRDAIDGLDESLAALQKALLDQAETHAETLMPGYTHLQAAQPVTLGHHLLAYVEMFGRDRGRFADARARLNESPLGAAALAGAPWPIDRDMTAAELGFSAPMRNSLDAVSSRDFALEFLAAAAVCGAHVSRLAEEIVIWCSAPFGFVRLADEFSSGSSIMPQKRNPDAAELGRAKAGRLIGAFVTLAAAVKGLPLAYSKDMQEDKEPVFDAADTLFVVLAAAAGMTASAVFQPAAMRRALDEGFITATDLADWLVRELNLPFRDAHHVTGRIVKRAEAKGVSLADLPLGEMQAECDGITKAVYDVLSPEASAASRTSFGGTAPERVRAAVIEARKRFIPQT